MKELVLFILVVIAKCLFGIVRFMLFVLLLVVGRVLRPIASLAISWGLLIFLFSLIVHPKPTTPMWAGAGLAVAATAVLVLYDFLLLLVAPDGTEIFTEI